MNHALYVAFSGLKSRAQAVDVVANNLANLKVAGFKRDRVFYNIFNRMEGETQDELERILGDSLVAEKTSIDFSMGELVRTGNPLDVALSEEGFFVVETDRGTRFTRNGAFTLTDKRELATSEGYLLQSSTGNLVIPEGEVQISPNGSVEVDGLAIGQLQIVHFEDLSQLTRESNSLFIAPLTADQRPPISLGVHQGYLEQANVNPVTGVAEMISLMRSFETLSLAIRSMVEQVNRNVTQDVGRV